MIHFTAFMLILYNNLFNKNNQVGDFKYSDNFIARKKKKKKKNEIN